MAPKKIHVLTRDLENLDAETPLIRAWVSLNPHKDRTEYTDLSQVWHDAKEEPQTGRQIVAINRKDVSFSDVYWPYNAKGYVPKYPGVYWIGGGCMDGARLLDWQEAVKWAYIEDLLPKKEE